MPCVHRFHVRNGRIRPCSIECDLRHIIFSSQLPSAFLGAADVSGSVHESCCLFGVACICDGASICSVCTLALLCLLNPRGSLNLGGSSNFRECQAPRGSLHRLQNHPRGRWLRCRWHHLSDLAARSVHVVVSPVEQCLDERRSRDLQLTCAGLTLSEAVVVVESGTMEVGAGSSFVLVEEGWDGP
jgi:hypothetical protein